MFSARHYALVDARTGFVAGVAHAETPLDACAILNRHGAAVRATYTVHPADSDVLERAAGYYVHEAPAGLDVRDGENSELIALVAELPLVAQVVVG